MKIKLLLLLTILVFGFSSCKKKNNTKISFYYWRTVFQLSHSEKTTIAENKTEKLYVRYFDVDLDSNERAFPIAKLNVADTLACEIIPVVFIKNKVMLNNNWDINELSNQIISLVKQMHKKQTNSSLNEIQIDCDWSISSKKRFLAFMNSLNEKWEGTLSATIRLHQIKYFKQTGIPPVDYGVLMYYNMGKIDDTNNNSIYNKSIAKQYIGNIDSYPLRLKIALPIFSWGIQVRNNKVIALWGKKSLTDLVNHKNLIALNDNRFKVVTPFFEQGKYFEKNDIIIYEGIPSKDLYEMASDLSELNKTFENEIIFYDLDSINIQQYEKNIFKNVSNLF